MRHFIPFRHLYNLLLSILTSSQLQKVYKERKNFDLRRLLAGSERLIDYMIDALPFEPGFFLAAMPVFLLDSRTRRNIATTLSQVFITLGNTSLMLKKIFVE